MSAAYQHPYGHSIDLTPGFLSVTNTDSGDTVSLPIAGAGLRELGEHLIRASEFTAADCAEQAGHAIGTNCLDAILAGRSQAEAVTVLQAALNDLHALDHSDRAAGGFAVALVATLERGLNHA
ncbi:hypothetical protein [Rhodoferax sp.]|uniref:hypothetical protein n=1 Tax=Rhodoferax sp. TaxID=50421 RepID=UPI00262CF451|nr:hypothetical protein [Rhodoferax sp.]MDD5001777.1 hypothetical protein [Thiomonas arsenitoxydans]MDD5478490.1 hypothetical protein [Rhodoferax sp.]